MITTRGCCELQPRASQLTFTNLQALIPPQPRRLFAEQADLYDMKRLTAAPAAVQSGLTRTKLSLLMMLAGTLYLVQTPEGKLSLCRIAMGLCQPSWELCGAL